MKLLIADDEPTTINRILKRINFQELHIDEVRTVESGALALEACENWKPDILLSDIVMPQVTGIELATALKEKYEDLQIIFISGYMEKDFLRGAIHLQAINYIEKPLDMDDLKEALSIAVKRISNKEENAERMEVMSAGYNNAAKNAAVQLLAAEEYKESRAEKALRELSPELMDRTCFALQICFYRPEEKTISSLIEILPLIVNVAESLNIRILASIRYDYIAAFLFLNSSETKDDKVFIVSEYLRELRKELVLHKRHYTAGTGHVCRSWKELNQSFAEAVHATEVCFFHGPGHHSYYSQNVLHYDFESSDGISVIRNMKKNGRNSTVFKLREMYHAIEQCEGTDPEEVKRFYCTLILELYHLAKADGKILYIDYKNEHDLVHVIEEQSFLVEVFDFLQMGVEIYFNYLDNGYYDNPTINWIVRYIYEHYSDPDFDMSDISAASNLSVTYISHLFKTVTGKTVRNFITDYRMQQAVNLLQNPTNQINDIAVNVGYRNGNYFSYRFKEYFGYAPTEYGKNYEK